MASPGCVLNLLVPGPGCPFDIAQCEWLLDALAVRCAKKGLRLDWLCLDCICKGWLANRDVMAPLHRALHRETSRQNFPLVYNTFRSSLLQHYALRTLQTTFGASMAGSYPAALFLKQPRGSVSRMPGDIDVWVCGSVDVRDVVEHYAATLGSIGVMCCSSIHADYVNRNELFVNHESSPEIDASIDAGRCGAPLLDSSDEDAEREVAVALGKIMPTHLVDSIEPGVHSNIQSAARFCVSNMHKFGKPRQHIIQEAIKVRVVTDVEGVRIRPCFRHLKDLNIIMVSKRNGLSLEVPACTEFDLSCCSVAMSLSEDMRAEFEFYHDSDCHLLSGNYGTAPVPSSAFLQYKLNPLGVAGGVPKKPQGAAAQPNRFICRSSSAMLRILRFDDYVARNTCSGI